MASLTAIVLAHCAREKAVTAQTTSGAGSAEVPSVGAVDEASLSPITLAAGDGNLVNPERGFFRYVDLHGDFDFNSIRQHGASVGRGIFRLDDFNATLELPQTFFDLVTDRFAKARDAHIKLIVRFAYNAPYDAFNGNNVTDAALPVVLSHIQQLGPTLVANQDVIVAIEAGFVGEWGEWHDSSSGTLTDPNRLPVLDALLAALPSSKQILLRTPEIKETLIGGPSSAIDHIKQTQNARFGWHNDCFLDGEQDAGTFPTSAAKAFMAADSNYQAMVGETCAVSQPRTDCPTALSELAMFHWSLLNYDYHPDVIAQWASQGCLDTIAAQLGYRLSLQDVRASTTATSGQSVGLTATMVNRGFARPIQARPIHLVLFGQGQVRRAVFSQVDLRDCAPDQPVRLEGSVETSQLPSGIYTLALELPDSDAGLATAPEHSIRLDHGDSHWDGSTGLNIISQNVVLH